MAAKVITSEYRDLLVSVVELRTEMSGLRTDVRSIRDDVQAQVKDHETRLRAVENTTTTTATQFKTWLIAGGVLLTLVQIIVNVIVAYIFHV